MRDLNINDVPKIIPEIEIVCEKCHHKTKIKTKDLIKKPSVGIKCSNKNCSADIEVIAKRNFEKMIQDLKKKAYSGNNLCLNLKLKRPYDILNNPIIYHLHIVLF